MSKLVDIIDSLQSQRCVICRKRLQRGENGLCAKCVAGLPLNDPELWDGPQFVDAACAPLVFSGTARDALTRYKFSGATGCAGVFGKLVAECISRNLTGKYDLISWVPLSAQRRSERGYDQAMLIALAAALELGDVAVDTLRRTKNIAPQSGVDNAADRRANVSGAFEPADAELIRNKRVLLLDDVITTGATVSECAATLIRGGAAGVVCAAVARTRRFD